MSAECPYFSGQFGVECGGKAHLSRVFISFEDVIPSFMSRWGTPLVHQILFASDSCFSDASVSCSLVTTPYPVSLSYCSFPIAELFAINFGDGQRQFLSGM